MKKSVLGLWFCSGLIFLSSVYAQSVNQVAAVVNDSVITKADLDKRVNAVKKQMEQARAPLPQEKKLCEGVLQQMIDRQLQIQEAKNNGVTVTDEQLNQALNRIAESNHLTEAQLFAEIGKSGASPADFKKEIREEILIQQAQDRAVGSGIKVSKEEALDVIRHFPSVPTSATHYHVEDILIPLPDGASPDMVARAKSRAVSVLSALRSKQKVSGLVVSDLGWRTKQQMPDLFVSYLENVSSHDFVGPIQAPNGFHILHILDIQGQSGLAGSDQQKEAQAMQIVYQQKLQSQVINWITKLRAQAYIKKFPICG